MTTRSDSDECLAQNPLTSSEKASIFRDGFSQESLKAVSLPPLEKEDSVREMMSSEKEVKSPPLASVLEKDEETIRSESAEASFSKERESMDVDCHGVFSVPETTSALLEEDGILEERQRMEEAVEADGSVVCISEKKGQEDSDVQADVDTLAMASDVRIIEKNGNHQHQKVERVRVKDNAFVGRSVKIDVVDDTALLNVVPFSKKAKDHPKHKKNGGKHIVGEKGNASKDVEGNELRIMYSLSQMKSMRYANMGNQKKLWCDVYARLLPDLVNEYEGLVVSLKNQKNSKSNMRESGIGTKEVIDDLTLEEVGEEEYSEENDDYNSILKPAFAVDGEPDFESGPPEDGFEYLRRVRWEAKRVPNVKVAKIDESKYITKEQSVYMPQIPEIPKCPEHLLPLKEWEDSLLSDFSHLRSVLDETMPSNQSIEDVLMEIFNKRLHTVPDESFGGLVSDIQGMDSVTQVSRLKKRIVLVEKESRLERSDCKWVVALCASVETPLDGDTCACLRAFLRKCASLRALEVEDEQVIIMANMLITIAGRYFGQMNPLFFFPGPFQIITPYSIIQLCCPLASPLLRVSFSITGRGPLTTFAPSCSRICRELRTPYGPRHPLLEPLQLSVESTCTLLSASSCAPSFTSSLLLTPDPMSLPPTRYPLDS
ncbi:BnaC04g48380D [Brassica napus]|uniref:BnaC04g48380D protein n=1 Tax=Brassica napus TaxID=3708 RepID=A0A078FNV3_BRANA|nr:BnaC04g48380D [Brassica napus]